MTDHKRGAQGRTRVKWLPYNPCMLPSAAVGFTPAPASIQRSSRLCTDHTLAEHEDSESLSCSASNLRALTVELHLNVVDSTETAHDHDKIILTYCPDVDLAPHHMSRSSEIHRPSYVPEHRGSISSISTSATAVNIEANFEPGAAVQTTHPFDVHSIPTFMPKVAPLATSVRAEPIATLKRAPHTPFIAEPGIDPTIDAVMNDQDAILTLQKRVAFLPSIILSSPQFRDTSAEMDVSDVIDEMSKPGICYPRLLVVDLPIASIGYPSTYTDAD